MFWVPRSKVRKICQVLIDFNDWLWLNASMKKKKRPIGNPLRVSLCIRCKACDVYFLLIVIHTSFWSVCVSCPSCSSIRNIAVRLHCQQDHAVWSRWFQASICFKWNERSHNCILFHNITFLCNITFYIVVNLRLFTKNCADHWEQRARKHGWLVLCQYNVHDRGGFGGDVRGLRQGTTLASAV